MPADSLQPSLSILLTFVRYCERCTKYQSVPDWKYLVQIQASDHTAMHWLTCIGDGGDIMFEGLKASELKNLELNNEKEFEKKIWVGGWVGRWIRDKTTLCLILPHIIMHLKTTLCLILPHLIIMHLVSY
jgi:hypothetical protein